MQDEFGGIRVLLSSYWVGVGLLATALGAAVRYSVTLLLPVDEKQLVDWLAGKYQKSWAGIFLTHFDTVFGLDGFSWKHLLHPKSAARYMLRPAIASLLSVIAIYILFTQNLDVLGADRRTQGGFFISEALLFGCVLNILPDFISLLETRWVLQRFENIRSIVGQIGLLIFDVIFSGLIIWASITIFSLIKHGHPVSLVELVAVFSPYSIFFYSTFLTSVAAWIFFLSTMLVRVLATGPLKRSVGSRARPEAMLGFSVAAVVVFAGVVLSPLVQSMKADVGGISRFDQVLCDVFPGTACPKIAALSEDNKLKLKLFAKACIAGAWETCNSTGWDTFDNDPTTAVVLFRKACAAKVMLGCHNLGFAYLTGRGVPQDFEKSKFLFELACDAGIPNSCSSIGYFYSNGFGDYPLNTKKAVRYYDNGCSEGFVPSCFNLAVMYENGKGVSLSYERAIELYLTACNAGHPLACSNLGVIYENGRGTSKDHIEAYRLYRIACDQGAPLGCFNAATMKVNVSRRNIKSGQVRRDLRKACELNYFPACNSLAAYQIEADGNYENYLEIAKLYKRACDGGHEFACINLSTLKDAFEKEQEQKALAMDWESKCNQGDSISCFSLGSMLINVPGRSSDASQAMERACVLNLPHACMFLASMFEQGFGVSKSSTMASVWRKQACEMFEKNGDPCMEIEVLLPQRD